jgi:hypothetical protein
MPDAYKQGARTIASELESTFVVVGATQIKDDGKVQLSTRLLDTVDKDWRGCSALVNLPALSRSFAHNHMPNPR